MQINMRKILAMLSVLAMLCTLLPMAALSVSAASNLVVNGDFESGSASGWSGGLSASTAAAHDGTYGASATATGSWGSLLKQTVSLEANSAYYLSFWYKSNADAITNASFELKYKGNSGSETKIKLFNGSTLSSSVGLKTTVTDWTQVKVYFVTGEDNYNTTNLLFYRAASGAGDAASICVDTVELYKVDNMLANGGFESGDLSGWEQKYASDSTITNAQVANGSYSLEGTRTDKYGIFLSQTIAVEANTDYVLFFRAKLAQSGGQARFYVGPNRGNSGAVNSSNYSFSATADAWTDFAIKFNSGSNTSLYVMPAQGVANGGNVYFDDIFVLGAPIIDEEPEEPEEPEVPVVDSLIVNGDFETGSKDPWTSGSSSAAITINSTNKHGGSYGAMIPARNRTFTAKQAVTVKANTNYTVTFWYKSTDAAQAISLLFGVYDATATASNNEPLATQVALDNAKSDWTKVTYVFNSGDNTSVLVAFGSDNSSCLVKDYIYVDDIVMVEGGETPSEPEKYIGSYPETMTSGADIRFMTYNVLVGQDTNKGGYSWGSAITGRPEKACAMINYYKPDVIALEEFSGEWYEYFQANMTDYAFGMMESKDSQNNGILYTCLAYNKNTIRLLDTDLFRNTVSRWGTQGMRYVNVGFFEVIATGEKFIGAVTHPDAGDLVGTDDLNGDGVAGEGAGYWRPQQLEEAAAYVKGLSDEHKMPVIWGGDFNSGLEGTYDDNVSWYKVADAGFTDATAGRYIDHIFYNGMAIHLYETTVADAAVSGASDHKAVFADIQFLDEFATPIKDAKDYIKTQGRNTLKDGALWLDFSASGIEFSANCEGKVALNLNVKNQKSTDATYGGIYFTVIVDGVKKDRAQCRILTNGTFELVLAENLPAGNHTFEVYRQTEHRNGEVGITSITMNGTFNEKPADNRLYIEFIGDSISTGFGVLGTSADAEGGTALWQDATMAYPYLTAKALGADFSDVCYSGIGAKYGWQDPNMLNFYPYQRWQYDRTTQYSFSRQPDVVVIALGTNDISKGPEGDTAARKAGYQEMLDLVRAKNPNAKIVWIYGMMKDDDNAMIASLMEENGGAAAGLYSLELVTNTAGAGYHPSAAGQQKFADDLVAFLNSDVLVKYVGDDMLDNDEGRVVSYEGSSRMEMTADKLGLAFKFQVLADGVAVKEGCATQADLTNATIDAFGDGNQYKLIRMGAVVSNNALVGLSDMKLSDVDNKKTIDVGVTYLCDLEDDAAQFAIRITNIPVENEDTIIYARAYYVFEYEGREVVVYDDIQSANYINKYDSNDGVLEW